MYYQKSIKTNQRNILTDFIIREWKKKKGKILIPESILITKVLVSFSQQIQIKNQNYQTLIGYIKKYETYSKDSFNFDLLISIIEEWVIIKKNSYPKNKITR
jgi:hypothetical protein